MVFAKEEGLIYLRFELSGLLAKLCPSCASGRHVEVSIQRALRIIIVIEDGNMLYMLSF